MARSWIDLILGPLARKTTSDATAADDLGHGIGMRTRRDRDPATSSMVRRIPTSPWMALAESALQMRDISRQ